MCCAVRGELCESLLASGRAFVGNREGAPGGTGPEVGLVAGTSRALIAW